MSAPIKPKADGVNLSLTRREADLNNYLVKYAAYMLGESNWMFEDAVDLLTVIQSQSKESSNDS